MEFHDNLQNFTAQYFDFVQFHCILITFAFAFDDFESLLPNFGLIWIGSKFGNFRIGDGKS
jgi:hypothetical protein